MPTGGQQLGSKNKAWPSNVKIPKYFVTMENNRPVHYVVNPQAGQIRCPDPSMPKSAMKQQQTTQPQHKKQVSEADEQNSASQVEEKMQKSVQLEAAASDAQAKLANDDITVEVVGGSASQESQPAGFKPFGGYPIGEATEDQ